MDGLSWIWAYFEGSSLDLGTSSQDFDLFLGVRPGIGLIWGVWIWIWVYLGDLAWIWAYIGGQGPGFGPILGGPA